MYREGEVEIVRPVIMAAFQCRFVVVIYTGLPAKHALNDGASLLLFHRRGYGVHTLT
jgi:hypothetical protein